MKEQRVHYCCGRPLVVKEFRTAGKKRDEYLCVIDQVLFDTEFEICFMQDSAGKADGFLFDPPRKKVSVLLEDLIA